MNSALNRVTGTSFLRHSLVAVLCALPVILFGLRANVRAEGFLPDHHVFLQIQWTSNQPAPRSLILIPGENVLLDQTMILRDAPLNRAELASLIKRQESENWTASFDEPATRGGVSFSCRGPADGTLQIVFRDETRLLGDSTLTLRDLLQASREITLPQNAGTLRITRLKISPLQIFPRKSHVIHAPGEAFQAQLLGQFNEILDRKRHPAVRWELFQARTGKIINQGRAPFQVPKKTSAAALAMDLQIPLPGQEGIYDLRCQLETKEGLQPGSTSLQLVIKGSQPKSPVVGDVEGEIKSAIAQTSADTDPPLGAVRVIPTAEESRTPIQRRMGLVIHAPWTIARIWEDSHTEPETGKKVCDWQTIASAGKLLTKELQTQGAEVLILGAYSRGMTLLPQDEEFFRCTRVDDGALQISPLDPVGKDILEFLFREFDQQGYTLIPELELNAADEKLEKLLLTRAEKTAGLELRNQSGQTWTQAHRETSIGAHYDPLSAEVQQRIEELTTSMIKRYQHHKSFGGIAVSLHGETWACLPGVTWGTETSEKQTSSGIKRTASSAAPAEEPVFSANNVAIRCRSLTELYARIARHLDRLQGERKLYLTMDRLLESGTTREDAEHLLRAGQSLENLFPYCGIEPKLLARATGIQLLRPYLYDASRGTSPERRTLVSTFNSSPTITQALQVSNAVMIAKIPDDKKHLATDSAQQGNSVTHGENDPGRFWSQVWGSGDVHEVFATSEACEELKMRSDRSPVQRLVRELPNWRGQVLTEVSQPLLVHKISSDDASCLLVVNEAPFPVTWEFHLRSRFAGSITKMTPNGKEIHKIGGEEGRYQWEIAPYEIQACRIPVATLELASSRLILPPEELSQMVSRIERLEKVFVSIREKTPTEKYLLPNANFEQDSKQETTPPGWNYSYQGSSSPRLDTENPRSGKYALKFSCGKTLSPTTVSTFPLSLNREKFLAVSLWMRSAHPETPIRLTFTGANGKDWSKTTDVHCNPEWQHYVFRISEVPAEIEQAILGIQLAQIGTVWVDDVQMFPQRITPNDERQLTRNLSAIRLAWQEQRYADCLRLLDGYWVRFLTDSPRTSTSSEPRLPQLGTRYRELIIR